MPVSTTGLLTVIQKFRYMMSHNFGSLKKNEKLLSHSRLFVICLNFIA